MSVYVAPVGSTVELTFRYRFFVDCIGRMHYLADESPSAQNLMALAVAWVGVVWEAWRELLHTQAVLTQVDVSRLDMGAYYSYMPGALPGYRDGDPLPPFVTYRFRYARSVAGVRGGYKRVSGVPESRAFGGSVVNVPQNVRDALNNAMRLPLEAGSLTYTPVVTVRTFNGQPLPSVHFWIPTGGSLQDSLGTQNTRKR